MSVLIPTPVTLEDLIDETSAINVINAAAAQVVSPRQRGEQLVIVQALDDVTQPTVVTGTADTNTVNTLTDSAATFITDGVEIGDAVVNTTDSTAGIVVSLTETALTFATDLFPLGTEAYAVRKPTYWIQKRLGGNWNASGARTGNDSSVSYTLPVDTNTVLVHDVIYPIALADIATYPPITSAEV